MKEESMEVERRVEEKLVRVEEKLVKKHSLPRSIRCVEEKLVKSESAVCQEAFVLLKRSWSSLIPVRKARPALGAFKRERSIPEKKKICVHMQ